MNNKFIVGVLVALALLIGYFASSVSFFGAASGPSHYQMESFLQGISAGARDQFSISNVGALTSSAAATIGGLFKTDAGTLRSYTSATTTGTAVTLKLSDINGYDTISVKPIIGATTLTLFASSTASTWLPTAGDMQETCFQNATTTSAITLTFAGGTGWDMQMASSTGMSGAKDLTIAPDSTACFKFIRKVATTAAFDIEANLIEYDDAD